MSVETVLHYLPESENQMAGLVLFQNEAFHITLGLTWLHGTHQVVVQKAERNGEAVQKVILANASLPRNFNGRIELMAESKNAQLAFYYKTGKGKWQLLLDGFDATYLSTETAQGFIGTILALYASSNE